MIDARWPAAGERIGQRYIVERLAARGGMGAVYRAVDERTGELVALKIVSSDGATADRLHQEARVLSELRHPSIVRYLAHGSCAPGLAYLAMEWLDGEDLSERLGRSGLEVDEGLAVVARVARGLAIIHALGLVHRDIKPGNIRLRGGSPARATLIDFGVACSRSGDPASLAPRVTATGVVLGTVGYMSPEQATGDRDLDARSDVFALGCVLYECLTGEPAFAGEQVMAVLAKVLREQAPRIRDRRADLPAALDDLVARMLAKDRTQRPIDAAAVARALEGLPRVTAGVPDAVARRTAGISAGEQRPVSVMLALMPSENEARALAVVERHGGELARLANGGLLVTLSGHGKTDEQVVTAGACALALRAAFPSARIGLSTGWGPSGGGAPGPLIDRAASLLAGSFAPGIRIDEVTAGLVGARFDVARGDHTIALVGHPADAYAPRTLLGRSVPCVGRERELEMLFATMRQCAVDSVARAVVLTGPAGQGKSRLLHELLARLGAADEGLRVLSTRGDPVAPGSSLAVARQLITQAARLREGLPVAAQHEDLASHLAHACDPADRSWVCDFLADLLGLPPVEGPRTERFRAARGDARMMRDGLRRAFAAWIRGLCKDRPLLIVVDDLQWADEPSMSYLADALRTLRAMPLMVLGAGRPDLRTALPALWEGAEKLELSLARLTPRAAEKLVREALGPAADARIVARIVDQADGNALYIEELVRHVATGGAGSPFPDTVVALAHSRIDRLDPAARRVARAASVFGETFWQRGLAELLGMAPADPDLPYWIETLVDLEIVEREPESRFAGEAQLSFRSGLLRDAAYATLTEPDRAKGHLLAGRWLESMGERDALRLAEHYDRSGDRNRVLRFWSQGAATALKAGSFAAAVDLCHRANSLVPEGHAKGKLLQTEGLALAMQGDLRGCADRLRGAMECFEPGTPRWFSCVATLLLIGTFLGDATLTGSLVGAALDPAVSPRPSGPYGIAIYAASVGLAMVGRLQQAEIFLARAEQLSPATPVSDEDPVFHVALALTRTALGLARGELGGAARELEGARAITERTGNASGSLLVALHESALLAEAGHLQRCRDTAARLALIAEDLGARPFADWGRLSVAQARLAAGGEGPDLVAELSELVTRLDPMFVALARAMRAEACLAAGDLDAAEEGARITFRDATMFPGAQAAAMATLARVALRRGRPVDALAFADKGLARASHVASPRDVSILLLARADAMAAAGNHVESVSALREARDRVRRIEASIEDAALRESYTTRVEANALTIARTVDG